MQHQVWAPMWDCIRDIRQIRACSLSLFCHLAVRPRTGAHLSVYRWAKSPILATQALSALDGSPMSVHSCISSAVVASGLLFISDCRKALQ